MSGWTVATAETNRKNAATSIAGVDLSAIYGFEATLANNPTLMQQFSANPVGVLQQQTGVQLPAGYHCHYGSRSPL